MTPSKPSTSDFLEHARALIGTPFLHQGRTPGIGVDCAGVLVVAATGAGIAVEDVTDYPPETSREALIGTVERYAERISREEPWKPGDILVFHPSETLWHAAILTDTSPPSMVHALSRRTRGRVREEAVSRAWLDRLHSVYRLA